MTIKWKNLHKESCTIRNSGRSWLKKIWAHPNHYRQLIGFLLECLTSPRFNVGIPPPPPSRPICLSPWKRWWETIIFFHNNHVSLIKSLRFYRQQIVQLFSGHHTLTFVYFEFTTIFWWKKMCKIKTRNNSTHTADLLSISLCRCFLFECDKNWFVSCESFIQSRPAFRSSIV